MHLTAFDPPAEQTDELLARVGELVAELLAGADRAAVTGHPRGQDLVDELLASRPGEPVAVEQALDTLRAVLATGDRNAAGGELGYIPGSGLLSAGLAELIAAVANRYTGLPGFAPAAVALEQSVLRWMTERFGLPERAQAVLTSGGSMANLAAVVAARERLASGAPQLATLYVGEHAHASVRKAARIAGLRGEHVRVCPTADGLRLDPEAVRVAIKQDLADGLRPIAVVGAAGTTNTGAVDPLPALAEVARQTGVWFHVDAAYGGFFQLTERGRHRLAGIEQADSITLDPHKSLFLPFGTGALVVRERGDLVHAFNEDADYLRDTAEDLDALPDFSAISPELTRAWRGLRLWLPLAVHGVDAFRAALDRALDLAELAGRALEDCPHVEVVGAPDLSIVTFRGPGDDAAQDALLRAVNADGRVRLSSTRIDGRVTLRLVVLSHRTTTEHVAVALERITRAVSDGSRR